MAFSPIGASPYEDYIMEDYRCGCLSMGDICCNHCGREIKYLEKYTYVSNPDKGMRYCAQCAVRLGYMHWVRDLKTGKVFASIFCLKEEEIVSEPDKVADDILQFAERHELLLHPGRDIHKWAELVIKEGGCCPCVPSRRGCPCEYVLQDIEEENCCRCRLFVNEAYLRQYNELTRRRK